MLKAMLFVDADWLFASSAELGRASHRPDFQIDYRRMSGVLAEEISRRNHLPAIDVVRSHYFGSLVHNCDPRDQQLAGQRRAFFARLQDDAHAEFEAFDVDCRGQRVADDGDGLPLSGEWRRHVALAVTAMRYALTPGALDMAIFVLGDGSLVPVLQEVRRHGRRVAVASVDGWCAPELADPADPLRTRDYEVLWLSDVVNRLDRWRGRRPFRHDEEQPALEEGAGSTLRGRIKNLIWDRGYGFIAAEDGRDYFFHVNALEPGLDFDELQPDLAVTFEIKSGPARGRAGAARLVQRDPGAGEAPGHEPDEEGTALEQADQEGTAPSPDEEPSDEVAGEEPSDEVAGEEPSDEVADEPVPGESAPRDSG